MTTLEQHLQATSRTFAISIPFLSQPLQTEIGVAYLLFRIADTFEDSTAWPAERKHTALRQFATVMASDDANSLERLRKMILSDPPSAREGEGALLAQMDDVLQALHSFPSEVQEVIRRDVSRTAEGMIHFVLRQDDPAAPPLRSVEELREYCYIVAGIVGEMLTDLFLLRCPALEPVADRLRPKSRHFGEALQLVNILKDAEVDRSEGRQYLPPGVDRAVVFRLARQDLDRAREYAQTVLEADRSLDVTGFLLMPLFLAWGTLDVVERLGPGTKLARQDVVMVQQWLHERLEQMRPTRKRPSVKALYREVRKAVEKSIRER